MSEKKWPKCQTTHPECVIVWRVNENTSDEFSVENHYSFEESDSVGTGMRAADAHYTRTDIAEARIAELEEERDQLRDVLADRDMDREMAKRSKLELVEANRQLEALRERIEDAPIVLPYKTQISEAPIIDERIPNEFAGKRVALVIKDEK